MSGEVLKGQKNKKLKEFTCMKDTVETCTRMLSMQVKVSLYSVFHVCRYLTIRTIALLPVAEIF